MLHFEVIESGLRARNEKLEAEKFKMEKKRKAQEQKVAKTAKKRIIEEKRQRNAEEKASYLAKSACVGKCGRTKSINSPWIVRDGIECFLCRKCKKAEKTEKISSNVPKIKFIYEL